MPFIKKIDREKMNTLYSVDFCYSDNLSNVSVGDKCYYFYKIMVGRFKDRRRWTTAHNIYKTMIVKIKEDEFSEDTKRAYELAWQVFFQLHVIPYELEKRAQNGDI